MINDEIQLYNIFYRIAFQKEFYSLNEPQLKYSKLKDIYQKGNNTFRHDIQYYPFSKIIIDILHYFKKKFRKRNIKFIKI